MSQVISGTIDPNGELIASLNTQERVIAKSLSAVVRSPEALSLDRARNWTHLIFKCLTDLGQSHGHKVCVRGPLGDDSEWLYDMVWFTTYNNGTTDRLVSVPFVMECEWDTTSRKIEDDFEKLLVSNADTRLMICAPDPDVHAEKLAYYLGSIDGFQQGRNGDRFLIATLREKPTRDFWFDLIIRK